MSRSLPVLPSPDDLDPATMPRTRQDCLEGGRNAARPCPWSCCRFSLAPEGGTTHSCALDVVDEHPGGLTHDAVGQLLGGLTRERVRQIEARALSKIGKRAQTLPSLAGYRELATIPDDPPVSVRTR